MSNPWLKKNPYMSMWLSGANAVVHSARGRMSAEAKRQAAAAVTRASRDVFAIWADAMTGAAAAPKRQRTRK